MMLGQKSTTILAAESATVRLYYDKTTKNHSIELKTDENVECRHISKKLYDFLIQELREQKGSK